MYYVYILESGGGQYYVGLTENLQERLAKHNRGGVPHTSKFIPWKLCHYSAFFNRDKAASFEKYLKSGSGRSFQKRHLR